MTQKQIKNGGPRDSFLGPERSSTEIYQETGN